LTAIAPALERERRGHVPPAVLVAIVGAWGLAVAAELSGTSGALHNHTALAGGRSLWAALLLFLLAWQAMVAAMMLPSSLPLIRMFDAASSRQEHASRVRAAFLGGYVALWTGFGAVAFLGDVAVHRAVDAAPWLAERPWLLAGSVLLLAGAFQFSKLKDECLQKCRHPAPYLLAHYRRGAGAGFRLGFGHAVFCLGCCWALMLVMFASGIAVLWWMAALTALMVYEKIGRHGPVAARAAGVALIGAAVLLFAHPWWLPTALGGERSFAADTSVGPGPAGTTLRLGRYRLDVRLDPNRATRPGTIAVQVLNAGRPVIGARAHATFTMLDMAMAEPSAALVESGAGRYRAITPALGMAGDWGVRVEITPRRGRPITASVVDHVAP
jgi:predicted metal-binding membrane protein